MSEVCTGPVPFSEGYSYDHNGDRLTMTSNGQVVQQFNYNAHDKLMGGSVRAKATTPTATC